MSVNCQHPLRRTLLTSFCVACVVLGVFAGCATKAGELFPALRNAPRWPSPPDTARIAYVGQLQTSEDLRPGRSGGENLSRALFGKKDIHTMLTPMAVCCDDNSRLFVADSNAELVHVFDLNTRKYAAWKPQKGQPPFSQPVALAWLPDFPRHGKLLVADPVAGAIFMFDAGGQYLGQLGQGVLQHPVGIAVDMARSRLFVADVKAHQVLVLSYDGQLLNRIGSRGTALGQFNYPTNVALDSAGNLFVADSLNFRVQQFDAELRPVRQIGRKGDLPGYFAQPKGIALDSENHLYVLDSQFENVQLFNAQGQVLMDFGEEGHGPGQFWLPPSLFINRIASPNNPANRIYIADSYNKRIQVFDYLPQPEPEAEAKP